MIIIVALLLWIVQQQPTTKILVNTLGPNIIQSPRFTKCLTVDGESKAKVGNAQN